MHYDVRQSGNARQAGRAVEIGDQGNRAGIAPRSALQRIAEQCENPIVSNQTGQGAARHVAAADNQ